MLTPSFSKTSYAGVNEFDPAKQSRDVRIVFGHVGFVRPDAVMQPGHQVHIIGYASRQLLRSMHVGVNKSCSSTALDYFNFHFIATSNHKRERESENQGVRYGR